MDGKAKAIVAHLWWIGWVIALVLNMNEKKDEFASFYIRQVLGLLILSLVGGLIYKSVGVLGGIIGLAVFILWILSIIGAISGEKKETPFVGKYFQDWFKTF